MTLYKLAAAGVVAAAGARVAGAGPLHHAAALAASRAQVQAMQPRREHRRGVGERGSGGARAAVSRAAAAAGRLGAVRALVLSVRAGGVGGAHRLDRVLGGLARPYLGREDAKLLLRVGVEKAR